MESFPATEKSQNPEISAIKENSKLVLESTVLVILSGYSGSGKSVALKTFEDLDYYCVDNLPLDLLPNFVKHLIKDNPETPQRVAICIDIRSRQTDFSQLPYWRNLAKKIGLTVKVLFFEANDAILFNRYADTRRRHPLSRMGLSLPQAIAHEHQLISPLRESADTIIDTSDLNVHQLRRLVVTNFAFQQAPSLSLLFESFAYKRGVPLDADFVFDARVLPNPHWNVELRPFSGRDIPVQEFFSTQPEVTLYLKQLKEFFDTWLPRLKGDTRSYVTIAFGCTGGKHRSVYLAETLAQYMRQQDWSEVVTYHRELE